MTSNDQQSPVRLQPVVSRLRQNYEDAVKRADEASRTLLDAEFAFEKVRRERDEAWEAYNAFRNPKPGHERLTLATRGRWPGSLERMVRRRFMKQTINDRKRNISRRKADDQTQ